MILLFLGSWRSTLIIAISIPLSILTSVIVLSLLGETINTMTLGGLALAVGILVDDATSPSRTSSAISKKGNRCMRPSSKARRRSRFPPSSPRSASALSSYRCSSSRGVARYLFVPLAEAVIFAMLASYVLSRTLVPTWRMYLLRAKEHGAAGIAQFFAAFSVASNAASRGFALRTSGC